VQLEGQEGSIADTAALACRLAHQCQHRLELRPASFHIPAGIVGEALRRFGNGGRAPPHEALTISEVDLELNPDGEWMELAAGAAALRCRRCRCRPICPTISTRQAEARRRRLARISHTE
jgi:hypothetical protein